MGHHPGPDGPTPTAIVNCGHRYFICCDDGTAWCGTNDSDGGHAPTRIHHPSDLFPYGWWDAVDGDGRICAIDANDLEVAPCDTQPAGPPPGPVVAAAATQTELYVIDDHNTLRVLTSRHMRPPTIRAGAPDTWLELVAVPDAAAVACASAAAFVVNGDQRLWSTGFHAHGVDGPPRMTPVDLDAEVAALSAHSRHCAIVDTVGGLHIISSDSPDIRHVGHPSRVVGAYADVGTTTVFVDERGDVHLTGGGPASPVGLVGHLPAGTRPVGFGGHALWAVDSDGHPWINGRFTGRYGHAATDGFVQLPRLGTPHYELLSELVNAAPPGTALTTLIDATHRL